MAIRHRLSIFNIDDPLVRGRLIREVRQSLPEWTRWEIREDEAYRPDLVSYRYYGTSAAVPVVLAAAGVDNPLTARLPIGSQIALPPADWLRKRIKHYQGLV